MAAQVLAIVAASEAVGPERYQTALEPGGELVGDDLHVIAGGDDRASGAFEGLKDVRGLFRLSGMQAVPAFNGERFAAQFAIAGDAAEQLRVGLAFGG